MTTSENLDEELRALFQVELEEHLATLNRVLLGLEANPDSAEYKSYLAEVFRAAHSLKGAARVVNYTDIQTIAHRMEDLLGAVQRGELMLTSGACNLLLEATDAIRSAHTGHLSGSILPQSDYQALLDRLQTAYQGDAPVQSSAHSQAMPVQSPPSSPQKVERQPAPPRRSPPSEETIRVATAKLDSLMESTGELLAVRMRGEQIRQNALQLIKKTSQLQKSWRKVRPKFTRLQRQPGLDADQQALLAYLVANAVEIKSLYAGLNTLQEQLTQSCDALQLISGQLQQDTRQVRMLPFSTLFDYFPRMIRDMAREQGKEIGLQTSGAEIEVDRQVLELAKDPLTHLLRNAVDHGIELPALREAARKSRQGTLRLRVEQRGNNVLVELSDDGAGIDLAAVRRSAIARKLVSAETASTINEAETLDLIFQSGLSTAKTITDISGRGIGMDVVRRNVEQLHGIVNVTTQPGKGTTFQLQFPLTLATSQVLLMKTFNQVFALPVSNVGHILKIKASSVQTIEGKPTVYFKDRPLPLMSLARLLELPDSEQRTSPQADIPIFILEVAEKKAAIQVDVFLDTQEIVIKNLGCQLQRVRNVSGATILGDGRLVVVLNSVDLMRSIFLRPAYALNILKSIPMVQKPRLLIADDSITTRTLQKHILEHAGYEVLTAGDGSEALELLKKESIQLVISDVNMPDMDGIELTAAIRKNSSTANLPVILVTSLGSPQDRLRGMEAGADAYIVKANFDQNELLEVIKRLID